MSILGIKKADLKDASPIVDIFNRTRAEMKYLPIMHTQTEIKSFFTTLVENETIWIATYENVTVGFMEIKDGWLNHLYILPEFQHTGIGKLLLDKAKLLSPDGISLWVFEENKDAIKFYEREGFILQEKRTKEQTNK